MEHKAYKRILPDAERAVLFIHGIAGTPNHFAAFEPLVPSHVSVHNILLDGHGQGVKDFSRTSMQKWEAQINKAVEELALTHEKIYIAAHSMGTLFAIEQAIRNKKVVKLFLLAVPIKLSLKSQMLINSAKVYLDRISPEDKMAAAAKSCYGIAGDRNPFNYIGWIPRFLELFWKIRAVRKLMPLLKTPSFAYQSSNDEMVSARSAEYLQNNSNITVVKLEKSSHYYYDDHDFSLLLRGFKEFID